MSLAETRLLARRCPAYRRREPGLRLSRGTWEGWPRYCRQQGGERERAQAGGTCEALSTVAGLAFGPAHSSGEAPVMGAERRSRTVLVKFVRATRGFWEGSSGRAEVEGEALQYFEVARVGGIPESQSQSGSAGRGRVLGRRLRGGSGEQSLPDMESDVLGELLPAPGAGGGDTEIAWRGEDPRRAYRRGQNRADSGSHGAGEKSGTKIPSRLLWLPAEAVRAGCGGDVQATLLGA